MKLTDSQFDTAQDLFTAKLRATRLGTPERAAAVALAFPWEVAFALPQATVDQRTARWTALYEAARAVLPDLP